MRTRLATVSVLAAAAILLAGCGGGGSSDSSKSDGGSGTTATTKADTGSTDSGGSGGGSGKGDVNCAAVKEAAQSLISVQLLAQIKDPQSVADLKSKTFGNLDLKKFAADMKVLHQLDNSSGPLGDPKAAIDVYERAAKDAQALFDADVPAQADIDAYNASIGSTAEFLGHQVAISGALDQAGC